MRRDYSVRRLKAWMCRQAFLFVQGWAVLVLAWTTGCSNDNQVGLTGGAPSAMGGAGGGGGTSGTQA